MSADACKIKAGVQSSSASFCQLAPCACSCGCPGLVGSHRMPLQCRLLCSIDVVSEHVKIAPRARPKHMTVDSLKRVNSACAAPQCSPTTATNTCSAACTHHTPALCAASGGARSPRGCQAGQTTTSRTT
eukprot:14568-Heterococcus_DN1.PRE.1